MTYIAVFAMTGCAKNDTRQVIAFCDIAFPILISHNDALTDRTAEDILTHNLVGQRLCDWQGTSSD